MPVDFQFTIPHSEHWQYLVNALNNHACVSWISKKRKTFRMWDADGFLAPILVETLTWKNRMEAFWCFLKECEMNDNCIVWYMNKSCFKILSKRKQKKYQSNTVYASEYADIQDAPMAPNTKLFYKNLPKSLRIDVDLRSYIWGALRNRDNESIICWSDEQKNTFLIKDLDLFIKPFDLPFAVQTDRSAVVDCLMKKLEKCGIRKDHTMIGQKESLNNIVFRLD